MPAAGVGEPVVFFAACSAFKPDVSWGDIGSESEVVTVVRGKNKIVAILKGGFLIVFVQPGGTVYVLVIRVGWVPRNGAGIGMRCKGDAGKEEGNENEFPQTERKSKFHDMYEIKRRIQKT